MIASLVPTARFAQPIGTRDPLPDARASPGLFVPLDALPPALRDRGVSVLPLTYAVSLLQGHLDGRRLVAHMLGDVWRVLALTFAICTAISARVFRWE